MDHLESEYSELKTKPPNGRNHSQLEIPSNVPPATPDDPCEILVSGILASLNPSPTVLVNRILVFIGLSTAINHVFTTRSWKHKNKKSATCDFVVKFSSPIIRNEVVSKIRSFKKLNSHSIFGTNHNSKINVYDLLPKPTYLLLVQARKMYRTLNYAPPIDKNGIVFIRKSVTHPLSNFYQKRFT